MVDFTAGISWGTGECSQRSWADCTGCPFKFWHSCKEKGEFSFRFVGIFLFHFVYFIIKFAEHFFKIDFENKFFFSIAYSHLNRHDFLKI